MPKWFRRCINKTSPRFTTVTTVIVIFLFFFAFGGCQKEQKSMEGETTSVAGAVHLVEIRQMKFEPAVVRVKKGDEVRWVNKDITNHDITEQSRKAWASSPLATGESWSMVATESVDYYCNLHQVMKGKILVE
jgi:plastocyanin